MYSALNLRCLFGVGLSQLLVGVLVDGQCIGVHRLRNIQSLEICVLIILQTHRCLVEFGT